MSPDPYFEAFEEKLNVQNVNLKKHPTACLELYESSRRMFLWSIKPSTTAAKIPDWCTRLRGAWLIKIGNTIISSVEDASSTLRTLVNLDAQSGRSRTYVLGSHFPYPICPWWFPHVVQLVPELQLPMLRPQHPADCVHLRQGTLCWISM